MNRPIVQAVAVLAVEGYSDWEPAFALAELRRTFGFRTVVLGLNGEPIRSMGGMTVVPDEQVEDFDPAKAAALIIPGGDFWQQGEVPMVTELVHRFETLGKTVAAICAGTLTLAHAGLLDNRAHTSNGPSYIEAFVHNYRGRSLYRTAPCIEDKEVITASGLAPVSFAAELFRRIVPLQSSKVEAYKELFALEHRQDMDGEVIMRLMGVFAEAPAE